MPFLSRIEAGLAPPLFNPSEVLNLGPLLQPDNAVLLWNTVALQAIRDTHPGPPQVARMLAILHTCIYDAWTAYDDKATSTRTGSFLRRPKSERTEPNKIRAISFAAHRALSDLFPEAAQVAAFDAKMRELQFDPADSNSDLSDPAGIGTVAANLVLSFRQGDGSNQKGNLHSGTYSDYTGYRPVNTPDKVNDVAHWQPLSIKDSAGKEHTQNYIGPHWGLVTPFALSSATLPAAKPPISPSDTVAFKSQCQQVLDYSANLTDKEKVIAEYWADGPSSELPPGHWCLFAQIVSKRDKNTVDQDVFMFFAMTNAVLDASIVCWGAKREHDYVRPVTAIRETFRGTEVLAWAGENKGTQKIDGSEWRPYQAKSVVTPPFPEYYSGHSTFSAAAAEVLKSFTGSDKFDGPPVIVEKGKSNVEPGTVPSSDVQLSWKTFTEAADEAGISRRYGGIHFVQGDEDGRQAGRAVGKAAWSRAVLYKQGLI